MITLLGSPVSTNHIYESVCRGRFPTVYLNGKGKDLKTYYHIQAKQQWKKDPITNEVDLEIKLYFKDLRKRDVDNYNKILLDSLTGIIWEDDSQIKRITIEKFTDREKPRIEINAKEYGK